jgi:hypothetical protein
MMARSGLKGIAGGDDWPGKEPIMPQGAGTTTASRAVLAGRIVGFCIFVAAFFLPACREVAAPGTNPDVYKGWFCAWVTLINSFNLEIWHSKSFLAILSGWINPLVLLYLVFLLWRKLVWPRRIVAGAIVLFMIATWIYFALASMAPLIGHVMWIAGALMILSGEVVAGGRAPARKDKAESAVG